VSQSTASKALNGSDEISPETRAHVDATARRLGYRPNVIARSLKGWNSQSIGVVTDDEEGFFSTSMMRGIEAVASERGFSVFICNTLGDVALERHHLLALLDKQVDGILMLGAEVKGRGAPSVTLDDLPTVYLYCYAKPATIASVIPDDEGGARLGTRMLLERGHRRIAFVNGPERYEASLARLRGYRSALEDFGIGYEQQLVRASHTDWFPRAGYVMAKELVAGPGVVDAVFAASDHLASGALTALLEMGLRVPQDVSLLGFDDRPVAAELPVPLTTIALPQEQMGRRAAELLFDAIAGTPLEPRRVTVGPELIERESVGYRPA
jgi:LacI family transcriptional regulator